MSQPARLTSVLLNLVLLSSPLCRSQNPQVDLPTPTPSTLAELRSRVERGQPGAQFELAFLYEKGKGVVQDYGRAAVLYRTAAEHGHATAANNLGLLYDHGWGVHKDLREAARWYQSAAERGDPTGQCNLASLYFSGRGVQRDYAQAAKWFRASAEQC